MTCFVQYVPYELRDGTRGTRSGSSSAAASSTRSREYAPNVPDAIEATQVLTPLDLERTYGLTEGNIFHGDLNLEQLFFMRPVPGWAGFRTPVEGLYLCGAGVASGRRGHRRARLRRVASRPPRPSTPPVSWSRDRSMARSPRRRPRRRAAGRGGTLPPPGRRARRRPRGRATNHPAVHLPARRGRAAPLRRRRIEGGRPAGLHRVAPVAASRAGGRRVPLGVPRPCGVG